MTYRSLLFLFSPLFCLLFLKSSFGQKKEYQPIFDLAVKQGYVEAFTPLLAFHNQFPEHGLANYQLALAYHEHWLKTPWYSDDAHTSLADSALIFYKRAVDFATKKEVKRNRAFYEKWFQVKKPAASLVISKINHQKQLLSKQLQGLRQIQSSIKNAHQLHNAIQQESYLLLEKAGRVENIYYSEESIILDKIQHLQILADSLLALLASHAQAKDLWEENLQSQFQEVHWNTFSSFKALQTTTLTQKRLEWTDYPTWLNETFQEKHQEAVKLKKKLPSLITKLNAFSKQNRYDNSFSESDFDEYFSKVTDRLFQSDTLSWPFHYLRHNYHFSKYLKEKKSYQKLIEKHDTNRLRHGDHREKMSSHLKKAIFHFEKTTTIRQEYPKDYLWFLALAEESENYRSWEKRRGYRLEEETTSWKLNLGEKHFRDNQSVYPNDYQAVSLQQNDAFGLDLLLASNYKVTHRLSLPQGGWLIAGTFQETPNKPSEVFISRFNSLNQNEWVRTFRFQQLDGVLPSQITSLKLNKKGRSLLTMRTIFSKINYHKLAVVDLNGELLFEKNFNRQQQLIASFWKNDGNISALQVKNSGKQNELDVVTYNALGISKTNASYQWKGTIADLFPRENGSYVCILNFQEFNPEGKAPIRSKANGHNVLLLFFDNEHQLGQIVPVYSEVPVFATRAVRADDKELVLMGERQGREVRLARSVFAKDGHPHTVVFPD